MKTNIFTNLLFFLLGIGIFSISSCDTLKPLQATTADYFDLNFKGFPITVKDVEYKVNPMIKDNPDQLINLVQGSGKDKDFFLLEKLILGETILQINSENPETPLEVRITIRVGDLEESKFARRGN